MRSELIQSFRDNVDQFREQGETLTNMVGMYGAMQRVMRQVRDANFSDPSDRRMVREEATAWLSRADDMIERVVNMQVAHAQRLKTLEEELERAREAFGRAASEES